MQVRFLLRAQIANRVFRGYDKEMEKFPSMAPIEAEGGDVINPEISSSYVSPGGEVKELNIEEADREKKIQEFRDFILPKLEKAGFLQYGEKGEVIVDLDKFREGAGEFRKVNFGYLKRNFKDEIAGSSVQEMLFNALEGRVVLSKEDYLIEEDKRPKPKPLFYSPVDKKSAFDIGKIKNSDFYLGLWEAGKRRRYDDTVQKTKDGEEIPIVESALATIIYHPKYGDGYRDNQGTLFVRDPKTREYKKIGQDWLYRDMGFSGGDKGKQGDSISSPRIFLLNKTPDLVKYGLLKPEDFKMMSSSVSAERFKFKKEGIGSSGFVMIDGIRYYIGKEFSGKPINVHKVSEKLGVVTENSRWGGERVLFTFSLFSKDDTRLKKRGNKGNSDQSFYLEADKKTTNLQPYSPESFHVKREDEVEKDFERRVSEIEDFEHLLKFSSDLLRETGLDLGQLSFEEQKVISFGLKNSKQRPEEVIKFAKTYGIEGLRSFFVADYEGKLGKQVLKIGDNFSKEEAERIFKEYASIIDLAGDIKEKLSVYVGGAEELSSAVKSRLGQDVYEGILRRSKDLLLAASKISEDKEGGFSAKDVISALSGVKVFLELIGDLNTQNHYKIVRRDIFEQSSKLYIRDKKNNLRYQLKVLVRPEAEINAEAKINAEARINFELGFDTENPNEELRRAFQQRTDYKAEKKTVEESVLRVAIDLDTYYGRPVVSLDLGRSRHQGEKSDRTGDVLGNLLSYVDKESGHHLTKSFNEVYSDPEVFAKLARALKDYLGFDKG